MFEAASQSLEKKLDELSGADFATKTSRNKLYFGATLALGIGAAVIAEHFHVPKKWIGKATAEIIDLAETGKISSVTDFPKTVERAVSDEKVSTAEWLAKLPQKDQSRILSPHLQHADALARRIKSALREDGDIAKNLETALNEHSAKFFPYVEPVSIKMAPDDDVFMHAAGNSIYIHTKLERTASGAVEMEYKSPQAQGEAGLVAAVGHEYNHVEQTNFIQHARHNPELTEGQYQRGMRIVDSLKIDTQVEVGMLKAENEYYALRAVNFAGKKAMVAADAVEPANFAPFYHSVMITSADDIPPSFKQFVDKQNAVRSSLTPVPSDHDLGRQFFIALRGQIATARSRALMTYNSYQNLYHEREAFQLEKAIKDIYDKIV